MKIEQILALKTSQERPLYRAFATLYATLMRDIYAGEVRLSQLSESSQGEKFTGTDISTILTTHKDVLSTEFESFSRCFEVILNETIAKDPDDDLKCSPSDSLLIVAAKVICWLRLISIILNPPASADKLDLDTSFAANARTIAQEHLSKSIASKVASLAKQLLSLRQWTEKVPEQNLWEGISF